MQGVIDQDRLYVVHWGDIWDSGGYYSLLWNDQALPEQGCELRKGRRWWKCTDHGFVDPNSLRSALQSALRQAVYLAIKELATTAEDVIMVTSSIMKDMQANSDVIYRPNAIRALCRIIDVRTLNITQFRGT